MTFWQIFPLGWNQDQWFDSYIIIIIIGPCYLKGKLLMELFCHEMWAANSNLGYAGCYLCAVGCFKIDSDYFIVNAAQL